MAASGNLAALQKKVQQSHGNIHQHATQLRQLHGKIKKLEGTGVTTHSDGGTAELNDRLTYLDRVLGEVQGELSTFKNQLNQVRYQVDEGILRQLDELKRQLASTDELGKQRDLQQQSLLRQHSDLLEDLKRRQAAAEEGSQLSELKREMHRMQLVAEQLQKDPKLRGLEHEIDHIRHHCAGLERKLFDAGLVARTPVGPQRPPEEIEKSPPVGTLSLGEDMFSARLLLKLGYLKAEMKQRGDSIESHSDDFDSDADYWEEDWCNMVSGIAEPVIPKATESYKEVSKNTFSLCVLIISVELIAIAAVMIFGLRNGDVCVDHKMHPLGALCLHVSKALGVIVIGFSLGKRMMDNVTYVMVGMLMYRSNIEVKMFSILNIMTLMLGALSNCVLFAISTSSEGVWLKTTAMVVLISMRGTALTVAKSGVLGRSLSRALNPLGYKIHVYTEYPKWFESVRRSITLFVCLFILTLATVLFLLPIPVCPRDGGRAPNVFTDPWGTILSSVRNGTW
eukprot:TRINITY_DN19311_c0_g2_i1.p1 TRINITY_DN19311_c0_g2~~TRINITY_DN19311_c0_g2_i1.p1  ORF type:complete len:517 (+),score=75.85 TRINITY_DN19311_c0_g2_i1:27-1553(+)